MEQDYQITETELLKIQLIEEREKVRVLEEELQRIRKSTVPQNIKRSLQSLRLETERLKLSYPLNDLLKAKEVEIDRMEKTLAELSTDHPDREALQSLVRSHKMEREQIEFMLHKAEERFRSHLDQIDDLSSLISGNSESDLSRPQIQISEF